MEKNRYIKIRNILIWTLGLNWLVAFAKIIYGFIINSISVTADGFHSLADGASNIICLVGIAVASRPKDDKHPYGHKKYETFTSVFIGGLLFFISLNILKEVVSRFRNPALPQVSPFSFVLMLITLAVNLFVVAYEYQQGRKLNSDILISDSMHTRSDIFASLSVLIALVAVKFGLGIIDIIAGIFISILITLCAIEIFKESSFVLCDGSAIDSNQIEAVVKAIKGVKACHKVRTRGRADDVHIDLHICVDTDMHVDMAHGLSHRVQDEVKRKFSGVADVIVHIEPV